MDSINRYNTASFGTPWLDVDSATTRRHFFIGSKDSSAQFLAGDVELEFFNATERGIAYRDACAEAIRRLHTYPEP